MRTEIARFLTDEVVGSRETSPTWQIHRTLVDFRTVREEIRARRLRPCRPTIQPDGN